MIARRLTLWLAAMVLMAALWPSTSHAANIEPANQAYREGKWSEAIAGYEEAVAAGVVHEDLYYNLGNAYYRAGKLGPAIFNFERALRIDPGHEDSEYNLQVARDAVAAAQRSQLRGAEKQAWWVRLSMRLSTSQSTLLLLVCNLLLFGGLIASRFLVSAFARTVVLVLAGFAGAGAVSGAALLAGHVYANERLFHGVVIADEVVMREGPDTSLEERGRLHPGLHITVLAEEPDWLLVRLANGVEGWVPRADVGLFR